MPKVNRETRTEQGQLRCNDPSCTITQCFVCEQEQRRAANKAKAQKRETNLQKAADAKAKVADEECDKARQRLAAGWVPCYEEYEYVEEVHSVQEVKEPPTVTQLEIKLGDQKANEDIKNTNWTHASKMMLYGWVAKLNPFKAERGKTDEAWDKIASNVAETTKLLSKKQGRIDLSGAALRVYVSKQLGKGSKFANWRNQLREEGQLSGQAGLLSNHETEEFNKLAELAAMKDEAHAESAAITDEKKLLKRIKDDQMNDEIFNKAMAKPEAKTAMFKVLNKKRKKLEIKIEALMSASKKSRGDVVASMLEPDEVLTLEKHETMKAEKRQRNSSTEDTYDSDENANRSGQKKGRFYETLAAIQKLECASKPQEDTIALTAALTQWLQHKVERAEQVQEEQSLHARLKKLLDAKESGVITAEEYQTTRAKIIASSF